MNIIDDIIFDRKSIKWLFDQNDKKLLEVDNSYQRRFVWTIGNQIQLIETILLSYPIPEVYILELGTDPETGETKHSIIDGQQRMTSIFKFIRNEYPLAKKHLLNKDVDYCNKTFSELADDAKSKFWKYPFAVRIVKEQITKEETVQMFLRLNKTSTTLNPQELRHAEFEGLFLRLAEELTNINFWEIHNIFTGTDLRRMGDVQFVSQILIFFRFGFEEETSQAAVNRAYDTFNDVYDESDHDKQLFKDIVKQISNITHRPLVPKFLKRKVHLYTLFTYIYYLIVEDLTKDTKYIERYADFAEKYSTEAELYEQFDNKLILEYKELVLEGTQQRKNRIRRFQIIRDLMNYDS